LRRLRGNGIAGEAGKQVLSAAGKAHEGKGRRNKMGCGLEEKSSMISGRLEGGLSIYFGVSVLQMGRWEMGADGQMGRLLLAMLVLWVAEESQKLFACPLAGPRKSPAYLTSEIRRGVGRRSRVGYSGHRCCIKTEAMPAAVPSRTSPTRNV
jgi:hypothetical protein